MTNLNCWDVENQQFWKTKGKKIAWRTLWITTFALILSFATWFMMSAIVTKLPGIGFTFTTNQLFWLAAMPGLAGGTFRIIHMFLVPIYGTRNTITFSTLIKLIPCVGIGLAVMNPATPYWIFVVLALTTGFFLYIALVHLLPAIHHEEKQGYALWESIFLVLGVVTIWIAGLLIPHA